MYSFAYFLAMEIYDAHKNEGASCQTKNTVHKQAENNRNYIRKRWW
jgi:ribosomal protein S7